MYVNHISIYTLVHGFISIYKVVILTVHIFIFFLMFTPEVIYERYFLLFFVTRMYSLMLYQTNRPSDPRGKNARWSSGDKDVIIYV